MTRPREALRSGCGTPQDSDRRPNEAINERLREGVRRALAYPRGSGTLGIETDWDTTGPPLSEAETNAAMNEALRSAVRQLNGTDE